MAQVGEKKTAVEEKDDYYRAMEAAAELLDKEIRQNWMVIFRLRQVSIPQLLSVVCCHFPPCDPIGQQQLLLLAAANVIQYELDGHTCVFLGDFNFPINEEVHCTGDATAFATALTETESTYLLASKFKCADNILVHSSTGWIRESKVVQQVIPISDHNPVLAHVISLYKEGEFPGPFSRQYLAERWEEYNHNVSVQERRGSQKAKNKTTACLCSASLKETGLNDDDENYEWRFNEGTAGLTRYLLIFGLTVYSLWRS